MPPPLLGGSAPTPTFGPPVRPDEEVLEEIRERFDYATRAVAPIRREGRKDIQCIAGEPWEAMDPGGLKQRQDAMRPALSLDELGQYVNQIINNVRQNKRAVKVTPIGSPASDKTAELRQNLIRQIEYRSNAQQQVYSPIFEDAVQRSYGYGRVKAQRVSELSRDYELVLEGFPNPDLVTVDPDDVTPTARGIQYAFVHESRSIKKFTRDFPEATVTDFTDDLRRIAPDWIKDERIMVAEYWTIETARRRVLFLTADPSHGVYADTFPEGMVPTAQDIDADEWVDAPFVCHYLTNGVELLAKKGATKRTAWPGKWIPIFACYGKQLYVNTGSGTERRLLSMVRLARDPFMLYNYYRTCQAELVGMVPKFPYFWYEGSLTPEEQTELAKSLHEPIAGIKVRPFPDGFTQASGPAPFPQRQPFTPEIQALEQGAEGARRAIQASMGTSPLPTQAQRQNEKSGKALKQIEDSGQKGSFHFVDHHDAMIVRVGEILNDLIPHYYDAARDITVRQGDDQSEQVRINDPTDPESVSATAGEHDVTIDVGPEYASQREAASDFADTIISNPGLAQTVGPQKFAELMGLAIRLKSVGPIGNEMADIISPKKDDGQGPPTPQQMQELQAQAQQMSQELQGAQQALATDQAKQSATIEAARLKAEAETAKAQADVAKAQADADVKLEIARIQSDTELEKVRLQEATKIAIAQAQLSSTMLTVGADAEQSQADRDAESLESAEARAHESELSDADRSAAAEMAAQSKQESAS